MKKPLNPEAEDFLRSSNQALQRELEKKNAHISRQDQLITYYEDQLNINKPQPEVKVPLHDKYPAAFKPLNEQILS